MRLTIHRRHFGVDPDGQWHQRIDDEWVPIDRPAWSKKQKQEKVVDLHMREPEGFTRSNGSKIEMVTVYKITEKTVPDFEAEVLCRNGWTRIEDAIWHPKPEQLTLDTT